jgi:CMP-2-keto-3-deoxyoctulosonic acid synthetase
MMRAIEHGYRVKMVPCTATGVSVDTEGDRTDAEQMMAGDLLFQKLFAQ